MSSRCHDKISVCLLTYNHVNVIESTLNSILDQTADGYELIVSDDCSTDGTWESILAIADRDSRVKPIRTPANLGMPGNANHAVSHTTNEYLALLHHDDIYRRDLLEKWAAVLDRNPDVAFVFNQYAMFDSLKVYSEPLSNERIDGDAFLNNFLFPRWGCPVRGTAMVRREAWNQLGGMREEFGLLADIDLWMRLSMYWNVGYVAEPLITVRQQRPSYYPEIYQSHEWSWRRQRFLYEIHAANRKAYLDLCSLMGAIQWWYFRLRLSSQTAKWLSYGLLRKKVEIIANSAESETEYDLWFLKAFRRTLMAGAEAQQQGRV